MNDHRINQSIFAARTEETLVAWSSRSPEEVAAATELRSRQQQDSTVITVIFREFSFKFLPKMSRENFIEAWERHELEGRTQVPQTIDPYGGAQ